MTLDLTAVTLTDLDLTDCHARDVRFDGATFTGVAGFGGATFTDVARFGGATRRTLVAERCSPSARVCVGLDEQVSVVLRRRHDTVVILSVPSGATAFSGAQFGRSGRDPSQGTIHSARYTTCCTATA
jgi:hypothetical protein